jgi:uncharacterized protein (TIGR02145 family)
MKRTSVFLLCIIFSIAIYAQGTNYKGHRTWPFISSLMGKSIEETKTLLKNKGMVDSRNAKDEATGIEVYYFVAVNSTDPDDELPYAFFFKTGKVVATFTTYAYGDEEQNTILKQDLAEIIKQLKLSGYTLTNKESDVSTGMGMEFQNDIYYFNQPNQKNEVRIYHDIAMASFSLSTGEKKYQDLMNDDGTADNEGTNTPDNHVDAQEKTIPVKQEIVQYLEATPIVIGTQTWDNRNLDVSAFINGDKILEAKTVAEWVKAGNEGTPAWCYYNNDPANRYKYGRQYNWYAVNDPRGMARKGWHVPSKEEVDVLVKYLGGGETAPLKLKTKDLWENNSSGNNSSGFSAIPGGERNVNGSFTDLNAGAYFWTSTLYIKEDGTKRAYYYFMQARDGLKNSNVSGFGNGYSVRCIKDAAKTEVRTTKYENGSLKSEGHYLGDVVHGKYTHFYENGKIKQVGEYLNGKEEGKFTVYYESGSVKAIIPYSKGVKQGDYFEYFEDGKLKNQYYYDKGELLNHAPEKEEISDNMLSFWDDFTFDFDSIIAQKIRDANLAGETTIGQQVWAVKNLDTERFRNGDLIPEAKTKETWQYAAKSGTPAWCYVMMDASNGPKYGKLYNWYAVNDARGLAPNGWHIPSKDEVDVMVKSLGGGEAASDKVKTADFWINKGGGSNSSAFSAMPGGKRYQDGSFDEFNFGGYFWTSTLYIKEGGEKCAHHFLMQSGNGPLMNGNIALLGYGCSVRCIKN